jgi:hypothetical protein
MTPRSVAKIFVRFTGKNPPRDFNSHVVSSEFRKQGKCVVTSETNVHVRWSPRVRNECSVARVWKISSRRLRVLGAAWMLTEMHVVKFSGAIAAMRNWSEVTLVRRLRENRAASVTAPEGTAMGARVEVIFRPGWGRFFSRALTHGLRRGLYSVAASRLEKPWQLLLAFRRAWYLSHRTMTFVTLSSRYLPPTMAMESERFLRPGSAACSHTRLGIREKF